MTKSRGVLRHRWLHATSSAALAIPLAVAALPSSQAKADDIIISITRVTALDKIDALSKPDFFARVTIAGETFNTDFVKDQEDIQPNWIIKKSVRPGTRDVKIQILDKDVTKNETVDINRLPGKRDLDFKVNTRTCEITGFSTAYACNTAIKRAGDERRKAELTFTVDVKR